MSEIIYYSASQLTTFKRCNMKWWWERIAKIEVPQAASAARGTEIHAGVENFVKDGLPPGDDRAKLVVAKLYEKWPEVEWRSERRIELDLAPGRKFIGYVDLTAAAGRALIVDVKSTSDVARYGKTEYQLKEDLQLNCYAYEAFQNLWPSDDIITVAHLQVQTRGRMLARAVEADLEHSEVEAKWQDDYVKTMDEMDLVRLKKSPNEVTPNPKACDDYGGCPHRARCASLMFTDVIWDEREEAKPDQSWNWEEMLLPPDTTRRPEGTPGATPDTVHTETKEKRKMGFLDDLKAMGAGPITVEEEPKGKVEAFTQAPLSGGDDTIVETTPPKTPPPGAKVFFGATGAEMRTPAPPATRSKLEETASAEPAKRPRGRPRKAVETVVPAAEVVRTVPVEIPPPIMPVLSAESIEKIHALNTAAESSAPPSAEASKDVGEIDFLFIDCFPQCGFKNAPIRFGQWVLPILEAIRRHTGVDWQFHDYRKGPAVLNQYAKRAPLPAALIIDSRSPEVTVLWEYLISKAVKGTIVQGVRS